jgi:hypothetical protein
LRFTNGTKDAQQQPKKQIYENTFSIHRLVKDNLQDPDNSDASQQLTKQCQS